MSNTPANNALPQSVVSEPAGETRWRDEVGLLVVYILLFALLSWLAHPYFLRQRNLLGILVTTSTIGICSVTATMAIIAGGIDLSIGSIVAFSGVTVAQLSQHMPMPMAILASASGRRDHWCIQRARQGRTRGHQPVHHDALYALGLCA